MKTKYHCITALASFLVIAESNSMEADARPTFRPVDQEKGQITTMEPTKAPNEADAVYAIQRPYTEKRNFLNCGPGSTESLIEELAKRRNLRKNITNRSNSDQLAIKKHLKESNTYAYHTAVSHLIERDLYTKEESEEFLTWFWINHFSVFFAKGDVAIALCDYIKTIEDHSKGNFENLLKAIITHPAMLIYLDNNSNTVKNLNENYAREILELHTLGVNGGYKQKDVQELSRALTGYQVPNVADLPASAGGTFVRSLHDADDKTILGTTVKGSVDGELDIIVRILANHPSTAKHIARRLCVYLVSDTPHQTLVEGAAQIFEKTNGDISRVVEFIRKEKRKHRINDEKFKSPYQYTITSLRLTSPPKSTRIIRFAARMSETLGEPIFSRRTPDGYPIITNTWITPAQITSRLAGAKRISLLSHEFEGKNPLEEKKLIENRKDASTSIYMQIASPAFMYH